MHVIQSFGNLAMKIVVMDFNHVEARIHHYNQPTLVMQWLMLWFSTQQSSQIEKK